MYSDAFMPLCNVYNYFKFDVLCNLCYGITLKLIPHGGLNNTIISKSILACDLYNAIILKLILPCDLNDFRIAFSIWLMQSNDFKIDSFFIWLMQWNSVKISYS